MDELDDRTPCITFCFSFVIMLVSFFIYYLLCGCPVTADSEQGAHNKMENYDTEIKWSDVVINWFSGTSTLKDGEEGERKIIEIEEAVGLKDDKSNSIREYLKSYLSQPADTRRSRPSYFAMAEQLNDDIMKTPTENLVENIFPEFNELK